MAMMLCEILEFGMHLRLIKPMSSVINCLIVVYIQYSSVEITPNKASILSKVRFYKLVLAFEHIHVLIVHITSIYQLVLSRFYLLQ